MAGTSSSKSISRNRIASKAIGVATIYACIYLVYNSLQIQPDTTRSLEKFEKTTTKVVETTKTTEYNADKVISTATFKYESNKHVYPAIYGKTTTISWYGLDNITIPMKQLWSGKLLCNVNDIRSFAAKRDLPIFLNITVGCSDLYHKGRLGTGNFVTLFYGIRLIARMYGNVDVSFHCHDADQTKKDLVMPWLMGWFPGRPIREKNNIPLSASQRCRVYSMPPLSYMYKEIQYDLRKMAIGLLGVVPRPDHPSVKFAEANLWSQTSGSAASLSTLGMSLIRLPSKNDAPLFAAIEYELDDAVLHFRCGDLMNSDHPNFAFMKFSGYARHISPDAGSIGIITQPFDVGTQSRAEDMDKSKSDRCRVVVHSLVKFIEDRHPNARVRIRNGVDETLALTYARMIMANQSIVGISTFSVMPTIATFGTGYIRIPNNSVSQNQWLRQPRLDNFTTNVVLYDEPNVIKVGDMKRLWADEGEMGVLNWFLHDSVEYALPKK